MAYVNLAAHDLYWISQRLPKTVADMMKYHGQVMVVGGGFLRSCIAQEPVNDIDVFCRSRNHAISFSRQLASTTKSRLHITDNANTVCTKPSVQFIHRWTYDSPEKLLESFDFTIARACVWFEGDSNRHVVLKGKCDERFYPDLAAKRLVYCSPVREEEAGGSLLRLLKFYQRGYRSPLDSIGLVIGRILRGVDGDTWLKRSTMNEDVWADQLGCVVTGLLREVDPSADIEHAAHLPTLPDEQTTASDNMAVEAGD